MLGNLKSVRRGSLHSFSIKPRRTGQGTLSLGTALLATVANFVNLAMKHAKWLCRGRRMTIGTII